MTSKKNIKDKRARSLRSKQRPTSRSLYVCQPHGEKPTHTLSFTTARFTLRTGKACRRRPSSSTKRSIKSRHDPQVIHQESPPRWGQDRHRSHNRGSVAHTVEKNVSDNVVETDKAYLLCKGYRRRNLCWRKLELQKFHTTGVTKVATHFTTKRRNWKRQTQLLHRLVRLSTNTPGAMTKNRRNGWLWYCHAVISAQGTEILLSSHFIPPRPKQTHDNDSPAPQIIPPVLLCIFACHRFHCPCLL